MYAKVLLALSALLTLAACTEFTQNLMFGKEYLFVKDKQRTFSESIAFCQQFGATLPKIDSKAEQDYLAEFSGRYEIWLWAVKTSNSSPYYSWLDGTALTYTDWKAGEPDDAAKKCAAVYFSGSFNKWCDSRCSWTLYTICERKSSLFEISAGFAGLSSNVTSLLTHSTGALASKLSQTEVSLARKIGEQEGKLEGKFEKLENILNKKHFESLYEMNKHLNALSASLSANLTDTSNALTNNLNSLSIHLLGNLKEAGEGSDKTARALDQVTSQVSSLSMRVSDNIARNSVDFNKKLDALQTNLIGNLTQTNVAVIYRFIQSVNMNCSKMADMEANLEGRFHKQEESLAYIEKKIEQKFGKHEEGFAYLEKKIEQKLEKNEQSTNDLVDKLSNLEHRFSNLEHKFASLGNKFETELDHKHVESMVKINKLEENVKKLGELITNLLNSVNEERRRR